MILFLDDMEGRHREFERRAPGMVVHVRTAQEAILELGSRLFDQVWLDHDLAEEHYLALSEGLDETGDGSYSPGTGMDVVDWIVRENADVPLVVVHSWNPARGPEMHRRLREAGIRSFLAPFGQAWPNLKTGA